MTDPVTTTAGHTYERGAIEAWFADGHTDDPIAGSAVSTRILMPNHVARHLLTRI